MDFWLSVAVTVATFVLLAVLNGIIGNMADRAFMTMIRGRQRFLYLSALVWGVAILLVAFVLVRNGVTIRLVFFVASVVTILYLLEFWIDRLVLRKNRSYLELERNLQELEQSAKNLNTLLTMNDSVFGLVSNITGTDADGMVRVLESFLDDVYILFNKKVLRAMILKPDGHQLKMWASYRMPSLPAGKPFYIGPDPNVQQGVAGHAYTSQQTQVARMYKDGPRWHCTHDKYVFHEEEERDPPYTTFIASPTSQGGITLGVLILDSNEPLVSRNEGFLT